MIKRVYEYKHSEVLVFAKRYGCSQLVYYETCENMISAIAREKQIKGASRKKTLAWIEKMNPEWNELYNALL